jgi:hypothetical protein
MLVQTLRYLGYSSAHANVSCLSYTFLGGWAENPILYSKHLRSSDNLGLSVPARTADKTHGQSRTHM